MQFGIDTLVVPFSIAPGSVCRRGPCMARMRPAGELYRYGVVMKFSQDRARW